MRNYSKLAGIFAAALIALAWAGPAQAQASRTWVSGVGDDVNPCSRTAPCKTFAGASPKTAAGGEIDVLDPGSFGSLTITKALTIDGGGGVGGQIAGVLASGGNGFTVNAGPNDKVTIRNLTINGVAQATGSASGSGIKFNTGASLTIEHVGIYGMGVAAGTAAVDFEPTVAGSKLFMRDDDVQNNVGVGVLVKPVGSVAAMATLQNVSIIGNGAAGLTVNDGALVTFVNSITSGNSKGIVVSTTGTQAWANVQLSTIANNATFGIQTVGAFALPNSSTVTLQESGIYNNGTGILVGANTAVVSFHNNALGTDAGNTGTPSTTVGPF